MTMCLSCPSQTGIVSKVSKRLELIVAHRLPSDYYMTCSVLGSKFGIFKVQTLGYYVRLKLSQSLDFEKFRTARRL